MHNNFCNRHKIFGGGILLDTVYYEQKNVKLSCYNVKSLSEIPHFHSELEMAVCFSGKVNCFLSGQNFDFGAGDIVLVFPNQAHNYKMIENGEFLVIIFYPELIPNMINYFKSCLPEQLKVNFNESDKLKNLLFSLKDKYDKTIDNSESLLIGYLNLAMFLMKPLMGAKPIANISSGNFEKICNYCIHNYRNKITLEILSKELYLRKRMSKPTALVSGKRKDLETPYGAFLRYRRLSMGRI